MNDEIKNKIDKLSVSDGFIKLTENPVKTLSAEQKALLNRKGNVLFNDGKYDDARKIFTTTGYSDGLTRLGDVEAKANNEMEALKLYWLAHNKRKANPIIEKLADLVSLFADE